MSNVAVAVEDLGKRYRIAGPKGQYGTLRDSLASAVKQVFRTGRSEHNPGQDFWALKDLTFQVRQGQVLGVVGRNGAGKSTLLKILSRITEPTVGQARINGRVGSLLEVGTGFHPELTGRENIYLSGIILGMKRTEIDRKFDEIVDFAEVEEFLETPVKRYSSGMYVRLAFAVAAHLEPEILIVDEVLAVGDAAFQKKCLGKMGDVAQEGRTILFVSHNMNAIQRLCTHAVLLDHGQLVAYDQTAAIVRAYLSGGVKDASPDSPIDVSHLGRRGTGQVRVTAISYTSANEAVDMRPYAKGPVEFSLTLFSDADRAIGSISVILYDRYGTKLVNADTISLGRIVNLKKGRNNLRVRIHKLYLNPGVYVLGWWVADPLGVIFDFVESGVNIEVVELEKMGLGARPKADGAVSCDFELVELD